MSEYTINPIFEDSEIYKMWVEHYNLMDKIQENKKWEWEDEELTGNHNIIYDFDEWIILQRAAVTESYNFKYTSETLKDTVPPGMDYSTWVNEQYEKTVPEDYRNMLDECISELKDLVDGYVLECTGMYQGKSFYCESYKSDNITDIIEHMKKVRDSHEKVFLYAIYDVDYICGTKYGGLRVRYHGVKL